MTFSGTLRDSDGVDHSVGGDTSVTVTSPITTTPSASRSFDSASVAPSGGVVVTIAAADYGQAGGVTETLPAGFAYVTSSLGSSQVNESGQDVEFTLQGEGSFTYTVTASATPGSHDFSGTLRDVDGVGPRRRRGHERDGYEAQHGWRWWRRWVLIGRRR